MRATSVLNFQQTATANLRRPWQTFKDGQIYYGLTTRGSKRHALTGKQGNKHYYKGTGSTGHGAVNSAGHYIVNWNKVRTYVVPAELHASDLKPLVSANVPQLYQRFEGYTDGFKSPELAWNNVKNFVEYGENYDDHDLERSQYLEEFINPELVHDQEPEITKD